jgi:hypothetical protein
MRCRKLVAAYMAAEGGVVIGVVASGVLVIECSFTATP